MYLVKQCRGNLNQFCHKEPLQGKYIEAKVSSVKSLFQEHIQDYLNQNNSHHINDDKIKVKISGDGAKMTKNFNFILLSFSIL